MGNGIVPGSHKWDKERLLNLMKYYAEMHAGSVLTQALFSCGGENTTSDEIRTGVFLHYAVNWIRQEENQYLSCPPETPKDLVQSQLLQDIQKALCLGFYSILMMIVQDMNRFHQKICSVIH